ncbi:N-formylglutamate amidohydrolase [Sandaracinobacteroides saxicola]|uniref:N-formylglutamate amidohydrolase n=1 Tax=Sandaracinobacteroides saxicola TaxID=2759707 RepID=A0A7G5IFL1_9SPHN|nr:N-formylglutamate amidohydrolase [Sandaracinobacteroides saxicola]QMW22153.1 N-formylglutamate amidohydrolase [Sandaracinobacteroides saxicola]
MIPFRASGLRAASLLLTSPHSGTYLPPAFRTTSHLSTLALRRIEDAHVGTLLALAVERGAPLIEATHARAWLDLNRAEDELDPGLFDTPPPRPLADTERVRAGYGLIPKLAGTHTPIHHRPLQWADAEARIETLHRPWHAEIAARLAAARSQHGTALLLDCHSMPTLPGPRPAQVVLGDAHGTTADPALTAAVADWLRGRGWRVALNAPYAGGHAIRRHGAPAQGIHALQLEIDRALYMDLATLRPNAGFVRLASMLADLAGWCLARAPAIMAGQWRQAAE